MSRKSEQAMCALAVAASIAVAYGVMPAAGEHRKLDPLAVARHDPHSSGWLNGEAALRAASPGLSAVVSAPPPRLASPTVNDPSADTTSADTQSTTTIVDLGGGHLFAAFNDSVTITSSDIGHIGFSLSNDNGVSWDDLGPFSAVRGDPVLAYDPTYGGTGGLYLVAVGFYGTALELGTSTTNGQSWQEKALGGSQADKPWAAVDSFAGTGQHNLYVCYTEFGISPAEIRLTQSGDGGTTFSTPVSIAGGGAQVQGCFVTVSPNHQVNVYYFAGTGSSNDIYVRTSTDQGATFATPSLVAHLHTTSTNGDIGALGGFRTNSFPHAAVNPNANYPFQYVVFNDLNPTVPANKADVYIVYSTDGGTTWSTPKRVNDDVAGDQFMPTISVAGKVMVGYYSRSHDPLNLMYHRRGITGAAGGTGAVALHKSFQMGPDTPIAIGQDSAVDPAYMGDYDQIAVGGGAFSSTWADNRSGNAFHAHQPDVHYARIATAPASSDLSVAVSAPSQVPLGQSITFNVTVSAAGGPAADVFLNMNPVSGFSIQSAYAPGASCSASGALAGCSLGTIAAGSSRTIQLVAQAIGVAATRKFNAVATSSSIDSNTANNSASLNVEVTGSATVNRVYSTGNIAVAIPDFSFGPVTVSVPVADQGVPVRIRVYVRLNHNRDADLRLTLISPAGKSVMLSNQRGFGQNFGTGANDCSGSFTIFDDSASTSIAAGTPPFDGVFKPEGTLSDLYNDPIDGRWKIKFEDFIHNSVTGVIGCVKIQINQLQ